MESHNNNVSSSGAIVTLTSAFIAVISNPIPLLQNILALVSISVGILTIVNILRKWKINK